MNLNFEQHAPIWAEKLNLKKVELPNIMVFAQHAVVTTVFGSTHTMVAQTPLSTQV